MLVFPHWRPNPAEDSGCRMQRWVPVERFAPYVARPLVLPPPPPPPQVEEDDSCGSSPERSDGSLEVIEVCGWRGCNVRSPNVARLSAHVARAHAVAHADGLFYCGWRGCTRPQKGFNARYKMLVHIRTHTNERPHKCNQCTKSFSRAENLKIHLRSHSGEKPYVCPYEGCGKAYSNSSDRFKHTRTHTVDKPYCCKVIGCNKRYTDPSSLRKHVKTYKHFTPGEKKPVQLSRDVISPERSYTRSECTSPQKVYSPPRVPMSPTIQSYNPTLTSLAADHSPVMDQFSYIRSDIYRLRVPPQEMSYFEYTQMYDNVYRNYYTNGLSYSMMRPTVDEKLYNYEIHSRVGDYQTEAEIQHTSELRYSPIEEELPLNLECKKRLECSSTIDDFMRHTDLPLDLSTRIDVESI